jgi:hypothetical protein
MVMKLARKMGRMGLEASCLAVCSAVAGNWGSSFCPLVCHQVAESLLAGYEKRWNIPYLF